MKKTKEIEVKENLIERILQFESVEDAEKIAEVASGRKFCKKGERLKDICNEEIENYICKTSHNIILKIYLRRKLKKNRDKLLLESRTTAIIRAVVIETLNNEGTLIEEELEEKVKEIILGEVKKYKQKLKSNK